MSCANNNINSYLKDATIKSLNYMNNHYSNIYSPSPDITYQSTQNPNAPFNADFITKYSSVIQTNLNVDNYDENPNLKYITINTDDNSYVNCAVQTSVPWFTMADDYKKCEIVKNIEYDENRLKIEKNKDATATIVTPILASKNKNKPAFCAYASNVNKAYCENAWYDWIIIPNYHLGNTYFKDNSQYTDLDVYKCYKPCPGDYLPFVTEKGEIKCIPKKFFASGIFNRKYMYSSIALINLIGNVACDTDHNKHDYKHSFRTNLLYILHRLMYEYDIYTKVDKKIYDIDDNIKNKIVLQPLTATESSPELIYNKKKEYFMNIKSQYDDIYAKIRTILNEDILKNFDNIGNKDYLNLNEFTYKNSRFNENEQEMFSYTGMETQGVLTPPILIHTWMLSQIFKPLERDLFNYRDVFYDHKVGGSYGNTKVANDDNLSKIKDQTLFANLHKIFGDKNKAIRLKNIFYKAVTNCYDGKSTFSVNFISATKKALQNVELVNIIKDNYFYYFTNNINFTKIPSSISIPVPSNTELTSTDLTTKYIMKGFDSTLEPKQIDQEIPNLKANFNELLRCDDIKITNLMKSLKYYKDTDITTLYTELITTAKKFNVTDATDDPSKLISFKFPLKYFQNSDENNLDKIPENLYCHYLFSSEELEIKSCPPGFIYNPNVRECELIAMSAPPPPEEKSLIHDDDINIPSLNNVMRIFFQIIVVAVILYLIYIVYDLFGEFILSTINYILVNFTHLKQQAGFKLMDIYAGPNVSDKIDTESKKLDSKIDLAKSELENLVRKEKLASQYNDEVRYKEIQKQKAKLLGKS